MHRLVVTALFLAATLAIAPPAAAEPPDLGEDVRPADSIELARGTSVVMALPRTPSGFDVTDAGVARAEELGHTAQLHVRGIAEGRTELRIRFEGHPVMRYAVVVTPPDLSSFDADANGSVSVAAGESITLSTPTVPTAYSVGDPQTAQLHLEEDGRTLELVGVRPGLTDVILVLSPSRPPLIYTLRVTE